jgi:hypothetical protein
VRLEVGFTVKKYKAPRAFAGKFQAFNQEIRTLFKEGQILSIVKDNLIHPGLVNWVSVNVVYVFFIMIHITCIHTFVT